MTKMTPMLRQYFDIKERYKNELLFFRMGDFYEMFFDDAVYASRTLNIALTKRQDNVPMCGIPYHALNNYVHPILQDGKHIAICEQVENPEDAVGIVKRDVVRVLTPGSIFEEGLLVENERRMIASLIVEPVKSGKESDALVIIAVADVSTGDLILQKSDSSLADSLLFNRGVREIVTNNDAHFEKTDIPFQRRNYDIPKDNFHKLLLDTLKLAEIHSFDLSGSEIQAIAFLFLYIKEVAPGVSIEWKVPRKEYKKNYMRLDDSALKTLEILQSQSGQKNSSLLAVLDHTVTAAGRRTLNDALSMPLMNVTEIENRYESIEWFIKRNDFMMEIRKELRECYDIERIISMLGNQPQTRHLGSIYFTLEAVFNIQKKLQQNIDALPVLLKNGWLYLPFCHELYTLLKNTLFLEELPPILDERRFVNSGVDKELDEYIELTESGGKLIIEFETRERERLKTGSLKIRYNKVIGYFIEISKGQALKAPENYIRRQTLVNGERYTCAELQDLENKILGSRENVIRCQRKIFNDLVAVVLNNIAQLRQWSDSIAQIDMMISFADAAQKNGYTRPTIVEEGNFEVRKSRHPVVEQLNKEEIFVPNDILLNNSSRHLAILTGPNMAGKSTFIRQAGLLQIMAQAGSFVPADYAHIPLADRVFTRIGAYDRLFKGESTFYVEMNECAKIFRNYTSRSLILLDEVGRGTSTFDGISIARAMIEYLNDPDRGRPKTLFATHYAELAEMIEADKGIIGLTVKVLEDNDRIIFLRQIVEGSADKSYGIYVASLAGMPDVVIKRASELLSELEEEGLWIRQPHFQESSRSSKYMNRPVKSENQLPMFSKE